jgi:hypothetical protein
VKDTPGITPRGAPQTTESLQFGSLFRVLPG